ncbi:hypothetical protein PAL_GLEAN10005449 [Pteropus alecto]|uniref:Uncharacterized protein n=1 Tax=Pteropus alecto TaxID=9402 RepID=L5JU11_PTEAL|nr:hypothetical protein PAL_GLEAN10005449 [Pteropus alecto]
MLTVSALPLGCTLGWTPWLPRERQGTCPPQVTCSPGLGAQLRYTRPRSLTTATSDNAAPRPRGPAAHSAHDGAAHRPATAPGGQSDSSRAGLGPDANKRASGHRGPDVKRDWPFHPEIKERLTGTQRASRAHSRYLVNARGRKEILKVLSFPPEGDPSLKAQRPPQA